MKSTIRTLWALLRIRLSNLTMYRLSFFTAFVVDCVTFVTQLIFLQLLTRGSAGEWSGSLYAMFVGSFMTIDGLYMCTWFFGVVSLPDTVRSGDLNMVLLKPVNPLLYTSFCRMDLGSIPVVLIGAIITLSAAAAGNSLTVGGVLLWLAAMLLMYVLMYALSLMIRCASFWTKSTGALGEVENTLVDSGFRIPLPAIKGIAKVFWLLLLPYGLVGNFPALALAGMTTPLWWVYVTLLTAAFFALSLLVWRRGLHRYESASS